MIEELEITCPDIEQTVRFYTEVLELIRQPSQAGKAAFQVGDTRLIFQKTETGRPCYHFAIDIPHNKLLEAFRWIGKKMPVLPVTGTN